MATSRKKGLRGSSRADAPADPVAAIDPNDVIRRGATANFVVFYQATLGDTGISIGDALLQSCEAHYATLHSYFGGVTPKSLPFHVTLVDAAKGASHLRCASTQITIGARSGGGGDDFMRNLLCAEVDEVFMANQDKFWDCAASHGEALSRVLASDLTIPGRALPVGFRCGPAWLVDRPDWINHTKGTDKDDAATGCGVLFLNWLHFKLGYSWKAIVAAGAPHLAETYTKLTGKTDAWVVFRAVIDGLYGPNDPKKLVNDNPFWDHTMHGADGTAAAIAMGHARSTATVTAESFSKAFQQVLKELATLRDTPPGEKRFLFPEGIGEIDFEVKVGATEGLDLNIKVIGAKN